MQVVAERTPTSVSLRELSAALNLHGDEEFQDGNRAEARAAYKQFREICERSVDAYGETHRNLQYLIVSLDRVGDVEFGDGNRAEARAAFIRSREICKRVVGVYGETLESLRNLSVANFKMAEVTCAEGDREGALGWLAQVRQGVARIQERGWVTPQTKADEVLDRIFERRIRECGCPPPRDMGDAPPAGSVG